MFRRFGSGETAAEMADVAKEVAAARRSMPSRLRYVARDDFDLADAFGKGSIDLLVSEVAFEHLDEVKEEREHHAADDHARAREPELRNGRIRAGPVSIA